MATINTLQFHLFGPFEVYRDGQLIPAQEWRSQQTRAVGKILLARRGQVVATGQLIELLWPGEDPQAARSRLHVRISQLRKTLGGGAALVQTVDGGYLFSLDERCWLDLEAFEESLVSAAEQQAGGQQRAAIEAYEQARRLYRGDFLAEDLYLDWTFLQREAYRERYLTLLTELGECYAQQGRYRLAVARLQEALARDALRESIYVRLMLYHYYAGERSQALRVFERCCRLLAEELQVEPLETTRHLAEQIRAGTLWSSAQAPHYPPPIFEGRLFEVPFVLSETPLVGREREYAWLVAQGQQPETRLILLGGEAGTGKSRLVEALTGYFHSQGWQVLHARLTASEHASFEPLAAALQPLLVPNNLARLSKAALASLAALFPDITEVVGELPALPALRPQGARERLHQALQAFAAACPLQRTLLVIDDAQRLGSAACQFLACLSGPLKMLLSYRSEEVLAEHPLRTVLQHSQQPGHVAALRLDPLDAAAIQQLIGRLAARALPELAAEVYALTQGNPLYVVALLQHLFESGQLYVEAGGGWALTGEPALTLPQTVQETIVARLSHLSQAQRRVFDLAVVLGGEFEFTLLQQASGRPEEALLAVVDELIDLALLTEPRRLERGEFAVAHDRYSEVAYATLPRVRRKQLHQQAAGAIEQLYAGALERHYPTLADHYRGAEIADRERHYAALAGEQAFDRFAQREARHYLERALALTPAAESRARAHLLLLRERIFDLHGDRPSQLADLAALAALAGELDEPLQAEIALRQAAYDWIIGDDGAAGVNLDQAISLAQHSQAAEIEAAGLLLRGRAARDQNLARQDLEQALMLAEQHDLRAMEGEIRRCLGNAFFWQNNYPAGERYFKQALVIHREVADLRGELSALNNLAFLSQLLGELPTAREYYQQGLEISRQVGDRLAQGVLLANLGDLALQLGDFQAAQEGLKQALGIREQVENEEGAAVVLRRLGDLHRQQGDYDRSRACYLRAREIAARIAHPGIGGETLEGLGRLACEFGDYPQAQSCFEQAGELLGQLPQDPAPPGMLRLQSGWSLLHHLRGEPQAALAYARQALASSADLPQAQAAALTAMGRALAALGELRAAAERYGQALEIRNRLQQPHLAAEPRAGLAELALRGGDYGAAYEKIEPILERLRVGPLAGPDQVLGVYLTCYQVLAACQDARADDVLAAAHELLQQRCAGISNPDVRQVYLEWVRTNQEIVWRFQPQQ